MAVYNQFKILLAKKEIKESKRISYADIQTITGLAASTLSKWATNTIDRYDRATINSLCAYFECETGDLLIYEPDDKS
ncbi:MAG: helix-turn-helix transcriptional regulator [Anaerolineaceae bacterium]|nr:helix-turn-helix transcriptional regulator [Anaerolineaceae bacterium]